MRLSPCTSERLSLIPLCTANRCSTVQKCVFCTGKKKTKNISATGKKCDEWCKVFFLFILELLFQRLPIRASMGKHVFPKKHLRTESVSEIAMKRIRHLKCTHASTVLEIAMMVEEGLININTTDPPAPLRRHMLHTDHKIPLSQAPCSSDFQIKSSSLRCGAHCGFAAWNSAYMRRFHLPLLSSCRAASEKATWRSVETVVRRL